MTLSTAELALYYPPDLECTCVTFLSEKGGASKSFCCWHVASQASTDGIPALIMDMDPARNMTLELAKMRPKLADAEGIGDVLIAAGVMSVGVGERYDIEAGAKKLLEVIKPTTLPGVDIVPAGKSLQKVATVALDGEQWAWLLRDIIRAAKLRTRYKLLLPDTAGRRGTLVTLAMYAADVALSPITSMNDAVTKAVDARARVKAIQKAHPLRWAGVLLTGVDVTRRAGINFLIRKDAIREFGASINEAGEITEWGEIVGELPYRPASFHQAYQMRERLSDYKTPPAREGVLIMRRVLREHIFQLPAVVDGTVIQVNNEVITGG